MKRAIAAVVSVLIPFAVLAASGPSRTERLRSAMQALTIGETALAEERFELADEFFSKVLELLAEDLLAPLPSARAWNGRARVLGHREAWDEAAEAYGTAADWFARAFPDPGEQEALARYQRAHALWRADRGREAKVALTRAREIWQRLGTAPGKGPAAAERLHRELQSDT